MGTDEKESALKTRANRLGPKKQERKISIFEKPVVDCFLILTMIFRFIRGNKQSMMAIMKFKLYASHKMERGFYETEVVEIVKEYLNGIDVFINIDAEVG